MIPKIIHYCWFGRGEKSKTIKKCMKSWKKKCADYEIIEWNEDSFDINSHPFCKAAYEDQNWAFVSDYVRLYALRHYGGIYLDTDVEVTKSLDKFLNHAVFMGFEDGKNVANGLIFGSEKNHPLLKVLMDDYDRLVYLPDDINFRMTNTNTERTTKILIGKGLKQNNQLQSFEGITIYPKEYFCPLDINTLLLHKTRETHSIHWYEGAWTSERYKKWKKEQIRRNRVDAIVFFPQRTARKILGDEFVNQLKIFLKRK